MRNVRASERMSLIRCKRDRLLLSFLTTLFILSLAFSISAQPPGYLVQHFNTENGLTQNSIKGIQIDEKGYVWMITETGIVRYDGINFKIYDRTNSPQLQANRMVGIASIDSGKIYIEADDGHIYIISDNGKIEVAPAEFLKKMDPCYFSFYDVYSIYDSCKQKFYDGEIEEWALPDFQSFNRSSLNSIVYYDSRFYYFNKNAELISADTSLVTFRKIKLMSKSSDLEKGDAKTPRSLIVSGDKFYLRLGTTISQLDFAEDDSIFSVKPVMNVGNIQNVSSFVEYSTQNMFIVGTLSDGFYLFRRNYFQSLTVNDNEGSVFYAQAPVGTDGVLMHKGVLYPDKYLPLPIVNSKSVLKAKNGDYYLNTVKDQDDAGITILNNNFQTIRQLPAGNVHVTCFRQLSDGSIWLSTRNKLGRIERDSIAWVHRPPLVPDDFFIETFIVAKNSTFWIGGNKGVLQYDTAKKSLDPIPGLNGVFVRNLYEDNNGTIWIGTFGKGYYAWYKNKLVALPMDRNHFLIAAHSFIEDGAGFMWITTNRGLFQVAVKDLYAYLDRKAASIYYQYYDQREGLITNEFNGGCNPSAIVLPNGKISLPTMKGLVQFDPLSIKPVFPASNIFIDAVEADSKSADPSVDSLTISNDTRHIQFAVSSPYFGNVYNQIIEYKLEPNGDKWYAINRNGIIEFNNLARGDYRLLLRKAKGFGADNYAEKAIFFSIPLFFYETRLFKAILILGFPFLVFLLSRLRVQYLVRHKIKLENEIAERTKHQAELIDELETAVLQLEASREESNRNNAFKEQLAMIIAHDLQSPLRFFSSATHRIHRFVVDRENQNARELSAELVKASDNIYGFVEDFTMWLGSMGKNFHLQMTDVNLYELLSEQKLFFTEQLKFRNNEMKLSVDEQKTIHTDRQLLKIVLRNLIDNANKNTFNGHIQIGMNGNPQREALTIVDTGSGMGREKLEHLKTQLHFHNGNLINGHRAYGNGYRFIGHFCDLLGITVKIESQEGKGTSVFLYDI